MQRGDRVVEKRLRHQFRSRKNPSVGIDDTADAGRGRSEKISSVFHGSKNCYSKMLIGSRALPVPAIIGDRDQEVGSVFGELANKVRKYDLIADRSAEHIPVVIKQNELFSGGDITDGMGHA